MMSRIVGLLTLWCTLLSAQGTYDDHLARARSALSARDYQAAVTAAQQAIRMDDRRWEAYALAANAYSGQRYFDDAIGMLQMALARAPEDRKPAVRDALQQVRNQMAPPAPHAPPAQQAPPPQPLRTAPPASVAAPHATQQEIVLWKSIENSIRTEDFRAYLTSYPNGTYAPLARLRLEALERAEIKRPPIEDTSWKAAFTKTPKTKDFRFTFSLGRNGQCTVPEHSKCSWKFEGSNFYLFADESKNNFGWEVIGKLNGPTIEGTLRLTHKDNTVARRPFHARRD